MVFLDEIDSLSGNTLLSILSQLRQGFALRPTAFWQQHAESLFGSAPYHEIAPHLVLMAFLHRVVNGGQPRLAQRTRSEAATTPGGRAVTIVRA